MDPRGVFNQDETAVEVCLGIFFLILKYMYIIGWVPVIYKGVRNVAQTHLKDLPKDGLSGNKIISQQEI